MKQEMMDYIKIICILLQSDNHDSTSFLQTGSYQRQSTEGNTSSKQATYM